MIIVLDRTSVTAAERELREDLVDGDDVLLHDATVGLGARRVRDGQRHQLRCADDEVVRPPRSPKSPSIARRSSLLGIHGDVSALV
jgi:hypothetical protein